MQAGDGQAALDDLLGDAEVRGDVGLAQALPAQRREGLVLLQVVHRQALDVLGQRRLDGRGIVVGLQQHARQLVDVRRAVGVELLGGKVAPPPGDDLVAVAVAAHQQRLDDAERGDRGGEAVDLLGAVAAHVELGHRKLRQRDVMQFA